MPKYNIKDYIKVMRPLPDNVRRGKYGIPFIEKQEIDISRLTNGLELISINNVSKKDKHPERKIVHSFHYDKILLREYNDPIRFLEKTAKYYALSTFDCSMHFGMSEAQIINAVFMNRWIGAFAQAHGRKVIICVSWVRSDTYDICFEGITDGCVLIISTLGVNNEECYDDFINGYNEMRKRFPHSKVICVGQRLSGMHDDVCYIDYVQSFGNKDKYYDYWQPRLFNWDFSEVDE